MLTFVHQVEISIGENHQMEGTMPTELGLLTDLGKLAETTSLEQPYHKLMMISIEVLFLSFTQLGGTIPSEIGQLQLLRRFRVNACNLVGTIPNELMRATNLGK